MRQRIQRTMKNENKQSKSCGSHAGPGIEDSPVELLSMLNIIHGANDTEKLILDSFDFMCGLDHEKFVMSTRAQDAIP